MASSILANAGFSYLTTPEKEQVVHLIAIHDKGETVQRSGIPEALILLEADTLGAIDIERGADPTYFGMEAISYIKNSIGARKKRFSSPLSLEVCDPLIKNFIVRILKRDTAQFTIHDIRTLLTDYSLKKEDFFDHDKPICMFMRGLPGSGKSTASKLILSSTSIFSTYLNPDEIEGETEPKTYKYRILLERAVQSLLLGKNVLWDQPWSSLTGLGDTLFNLQHFLSNEWCTPVIAEFQISEQLSQMRVAKRKQEGGHGPTESTLHQLYKNYGDIGQLSENAQTVKIDAENLQVEEILTQIQEYFDGVS